MTRYVDPDCEFEYFGECALELKDCTECESFEPAKLPEDDGDMAYEMWRDRQDEQMERYNQE